MLFADIIKHESIIKLAYSCSLDILFELILNKNFMHCCHIWRMHY